MKGLESGVYKSEPIDVNARNQTSLWISPIEPGILAGIRVLALDDQPDARELVKAALEEYGAHVVTAESADAALAFLARELPNVIVSDIGMPNKDGFHFIKALRTLSPERGGSIPAVDLTAFARSEDRIHALQVGYQMHIHKPVEPNELVAVVASLVNRKSTADEG